MAARGDLLALVGAAPGPLRTLAGAVTSWVRQGDIDVVTTAYVVADLPHRWRVIARGRVVACDGERSWAGTPTLVTERGAEHAALADTGVVGACLYPGRLLGWLSLGEPVPARLGGRACWVVAARLRAPGDHVARPAAELAGDEHRFWFDAATGIVLRHEGAVGGEPRSTLELTDLRVDGPVGDADVRPPPDAIVRSRHELLRDHLASVGVDPETVDLDDPADVRGALRSGSALDHRLAVTAGPRDPDAARSAIAAAVQDLTRTDEHARDAPERMTLVVDDCVFLAEDRAVVWCSVLLGDSRRPVVRAHEGYAVRVGGRWLLERASFDRLAAFGDVAIPGPAVPGPAIPGPAPG